jgi:hypothetical protein
VDGSLTLGHRLVRVSWIGLVLAALAEAIAIIAVATAGGNKGPSTPDRLTENWLPDEAGAYQQRLNVIL